MRKSRGQKSASLASAQTSIDGNPKRSDRNSGRFITLGKLRGKAFEFFHCLIGLELDIWQYIHLEGIEIVPLYFSAPRPTVVRDGLILMVDDERFPLKKAKSR